QIDNLLLINWMIRIVDVFYTAENARYGISFRASRTVKRLATMAIRPAKSGDRIRAAHSVQDRFNWGSSVSPRSCLSHAMAVRVRMARPNPAAAPSVARRKAWRWNWRAI